MTDKDTVKVKIRDDLHKAIEDLVARSVEFKTVSDYVNFVLHEVLYGEDETASMEDEELLKKRLRDLGYL